MIKKIETIKNLAVFKDFNWDVSVLNKKNTIETFDIVNIIYGRNYSGKTSLSRVLRMLEIKKKHEKYPDAEFSIKTDNQEKITDKNIENNPLNIRVYNEDFIKDNLMFLVSEEESDIHAFAILGEQNVTIDQEIQKKEQEIGNRESNIGLDFDLSNIEKKISDIKQNIEHKNNDVEKQLENKARGIKKENAIYGDVNYHKGKLEKDIETIQRIKNFHTLSENEKEKKRTFIKEEEKKPLQSPKSLPLNTQQLQLLETEINALLTKDIKPNKTIQELIDNALLQEWVKQGIGFHKDKKENCSFCGNKISNDLWDKLDAHFTKESQELTESIEEKKNKIEALEIKDDLLPMKQDDFYSYIQQDFETQKQLLQTSTKDYNEKLSEIIKKLDNRKSDIFKPCEAITLDNKIIENINKPLNDIRSLINKNNAIQEQLSQEQEIAKECLRLNEIYNFMNDIQYETQQENINTLQKNLKDENIKKDAITEKIQGIKEHIKNLNNKISNECKAAEKINALLNSPFGKKDIQIQPIENEDGTTTRFQIKRNGEIAYNLSGGEKSLIAFCYFMAKLEDVKTQDNDLIIWIDDPISSLDSDHIFFVFSIMQCNIFSKMNTNKYKQVFVSTHNLDFLKYLKKIKINGNGNKIKHFIAERKGDKTALKIMPEYLKKYITEFNYLFEQIHTCATTNAEHEHHDCVYNFGNNLRKFLEAYLFFKYPNQCSQINKIKKIFNDGAEAELINRMTNELSHLEEAIDRGNRPLEIPEIQKLAQFVLKTIKEKDQEQYRALCNSVGISQTDTNFTN